MNFYVLIITVLCGWTMLKLVILCSDMLYDDFDTDSSGVDDPFAVGYRCMRNEVNLRVEQEATADAHFSICNPGAFGKAHKNCAIYSMVDKERNFTFESALLALSGANCKIKIYVNQDNSSIMTSQNSSVTMNAEIKRGNFLSNETTNADERARTLTQLIVRNGDPVIIPLIRLDVADAIGILTSPMLAMQACQTLITVECDLRTLSDIRYRMMLRGNHLVSIKLRELKNRPNRTNNTVETYYLTFYNIYCYNRDYRCNGIC